ncbi:MAG: hypothetical protein LBG27_11415 [Spirochaetaceae bacterium]|nr:hypothetical protein [Spirochaetaceae bacterium]
MTHRHKTKRRKVEALTANYPIPVNPDGRGKRNRYAEAGRTRKTAGCGNGPLLRGFKGR